MPIKHSSDQLKEIIAMKRNALLALSMNPKPHAILQEFQDMEHGINEMKKNTTLDAEAKAEHIHKELAKFSGHFATMTSAMRDSDAYQAVEHAPQVQKLDHTLSRMSIAMPNHGAAPDRSFLVDILRLPHAIESLVQIYALCTQKPDELVTAEMLNESVIKEASKFNGIAANTSTQWRFAAVVGTLDKIASALEAQGHLGLAKQVDVVSNSLEADLTPEGMLDVSDKDVVHKALEILKKENDTYALTKFLHEPEEFLAQKMHADKGSNILEAIRRTISRKIADLRQHFQGKINELDWSRVRDFLDGEFGGHHAKLASSADHLSTVAGLLLKGVTEEVTEALRNMHPLTGAFGTVPEEILHAAAKGGIGLSTLLGALADPQTLAEDLDAIVRAQSTSAEPVQKVQALVAL